MKHFESSYNLLNEEQKRAVEHIDGPLLVLAGPGTGKTQLLSLRAAQILKKTDSDASNILCLTYTNKAAINMKERLIELIGLEANLINVKTFHSFANEVIDSYPEYFWNGAILKPMPETRQLEIIEDLLSNLPLDNPLAMKFSGKYTQVKPVIEAINISKEAGLTPDKLRSIIMLNLAYINEIEEELVSILDTRLTDNRIPDVLNKIDALKDMAVDEHIAPLKALDIVIKDSFHRAILDKQAGKKNAVSAWKLKWIQNNDGVKCMLAERKTNSWWLNFCDVYEKYQHVSQQLGYMDLSDMIIEAINAIENHPDLRSEIQERYTHVMIDEFQDTNLAQGRLSHLIADHPSNGGKPNIMAVGDDDQTIYRFQGAELNNMRDFVETYNADIIVLTKSYRSTQNILDTSKKVIERANSRMVHLMSGISKDLIAVNNSEGVIKYISYKTDYQQYSEIADLVDEFSKKGTVAVLARNNKSLTNAVPFFKNKNVAINYEQQNNLLDDDIVKLILQITGAISALHDGDASSSDALIAELIRHENWGIEPLDLWKLALLNRKTNSWLESMLQAENSKVTELAHWLLWLATLANREPAAITIEYILGLRETEHNISPLINYLKQKEILLESLSAVNKLLAMAHEYGESRTTIKEFNTVMQKFIANEKPVHNNEVYKTKSSNIDFLSVHKAKGLEYDTVFIIDAIEKNWSPSKSSSRKPPSNLPLHKSGDDTDDFARLMYVAMTRAKRNIIITNYQYDSIGKEYLESSLMIDTVPQEVKEGPNDEQAADILLTRLSWPRLTPDNELDLLRNRLEGYYLSATDLTSFLNVVDGGPLNFLEKKLLRLPDAHSSYFSFGIAMHEAMEVGLKNAIKKDTDKGGILTAYEQALYKQAITLNEFERYSQHGNDILMRLFDKYNFEFNKNALPEEKIKITTTEGVRMTGKIDALHINDNDIWFDDYKTGKPLNSLDPNQKTDAEKKWRIRSQIIFYYILIGASKYSKNRSISKANIIYLEADSKKDLFLTYTPDEEEISSLQKIIPIVWKHIKELNFPDTSHYSKDYDGIMQFAKDLADGKI